MKNFYTQITKHPKGILILFGILSVISICFYPFISVNYNINDYLPENSESTVSLDIMNIEFDGAIPNARVMYRMALKN